MSSPALPARDKEHLHEYVHYGHHAVDETSSESDSGDESQSAGQSATEPSKAFEQPQFSTPPKSPSKPAPVLALVREATPATPRASPASTLAVECAAPFAALSGTPPARLRVVPARRLAASTLLPSARGPAHQRFDACEAALDALLADAVACANAAAGNESSPLEANAAGRETDHAEASSDGAFAAVVAQSSFRDARSARSASAAPTLDALQLACDAAIARCNHVHGAVSGMLLASDRETMLGTVASVVRRDCARDCARRRPMVAKRCGACIDETGAPACTVSDVLAPTSCAALIAAAQSLGFAPAGAASFLLSRDGVLARHLWSRIAPFVPTVCGGRPVLGLSDQLRYVRRSARAAGAGRGARPALHRRERPP